MKRKTLLSVIGGSIFLLLAILILKSCFFYPDYNFESYENGYAITGCNNCSERMVFPDYYKRKPVLKISPLVLYPLRFSITGENIDSVKIIIIPESVELIEHEAFYGVVNLQEVHISKNVMEIAPSAFSGCDKMSIYGYTDSYAEQYAEENGIPFVAKE